MNCEGFYEAEVVEETTGEVVQYWKSKNIVNYGFIGGLFKELFGVGNTSALIQSSSDVSKVPYAEKSKFKRLYLFTNSGTPTASEVDTPATYTPDIVSGNPDTGNSTKLLTSQSDGITYSSVTFVPSEKKITMTIQVSYGTSQGLITGQNSTQWNSMGIGSDDISGYSKLITRVTMGGGITKTSSQTLRVRYNFSIAVNN